MRNAFFMNIFERKLKLCLIYIYSLLWDVWHSLCVRHVIFPVLFDFESKICSLLVQVLHHLHLERKQTLSMIFMAGRGCLLCWRSGGMKRAGEDLTGDAASRKTPFFIAQLSLIPLDTLQGLTYPVLRLPRMQTVAFVEPPWIQYTLILVTHLNHFLVIRAVPITNCCRIWSIQLKK